MSVNNSVSAKFEAYKLEIEAKMKMKPDKIKSDNMRTINYIDKKISAITSNKNSSSSDQLKDDIMKRPLLKSPGKSSHASQLTKHFYSLNLEGDILI